MRKSMRVAIVAVGFFFAPFVWSAREMRDARAADEGAEIPKLRAELDQLKGLLPSQSQTPALSLRYIRSPVPLRPCVGVPVFVFAFNPGSPTIPANA